jgi:hypothetical protein
LLKQLESSLAGCVVPFLSHVLPSAYRRVHIYIQVPRPTRSCIGIVVIVS